MWEDVFSDGESPGCGVNGAGCIGLEGILDCLGVGEDEVWGSVGG